MHLTGNYVALLTGALAVHASLFGGSSNSKSEAADARAKLSSGWESVTVGSTIKLAHTKTLTRLQLPQVSYGTGSQQQAVTSFGDTQTTKGLWLVEQPHKARGSPIICGSSVRLVNSDSGHSLHSHESHRAPISGAQEVSGFDGRDTGDLWTVECDGDRWLRETPVYLRHEETGKYLQSLAGKKYGQPISGHQEVSGGKKPDTNAQWTAMEGYYFAHIK
ncbi:hypothetical protein H4R99_000331 [Coemansia sp. RSA 1722]|nr:hypothetical protein LPJ57_003411 [Coemansia sp. RSA 486]KAJ2606499.1 hypothetical protein H4R99_000331 [Coemansia sp. RSA 1722]